MEGLTRRASTSVLDRATFRISACVRRPQSLTRLQTYLGDRAKHFDLGYGDDAIRMAQQARLVILGCHPNDVDSVLEKVDYTPPYTEKTIVSLMAGVSLTQLRLKLQANGAPDGTPIVRVMPSIGARSGNSVSLLAHPASVEEAKVRPVVDFFSQVGSVLPADEEVFDKGTAVAATCHALTILAVDSITDAAVAEGLPRADAVPLASQCLHSATGLLAAGVTVELLKVAVSAPKALTINWMLILERGGTRAAIANAVRTAVESV